MNRLIKSEIHKGFNSSEGYIEIFKNPTQKEIEDTRNSTHYKSIRGLIYDISGSFFIWPGIILHHEIINYAPELDINEFRFAYEPLGWLFDANYDYTLKEITDLTIKYENILKKIGDISLDFHIINTKDEDSINSSLEDNMKIKSNNRRLIKSEFYNSIKIKNIFTDNKTFEIFKNPTQSEIEITRNSDTHKAIRGVIYNDGTIYIWPGIILHHEIIDYAPMLDINEFRFSYEPKIRWVIDCANTFSKEEAIELINGYKNQLSKIGDINLEFNLFYTTNGGPQTIRYFISDGEKEYE